MIDRQRLSGAVAVLVISMNLILGLAFSLGSRQAFILHWLLPVVTGCLSWALVAFMAAQLQSLSFRAALVRTDPVAAFLSFEVLSQAIEIPRYVALVAGPMLYVALELLSGRLHGWRHGRRSAL